MMRLNSFLFLTVLIVSSAYAQEPTLTIPQMYTWYSQRGDVLIADIRPQFRQVLTQAEATTERALTYDVPVTGNINGFALRNGTTEITAGMLWAVDQVSEMLSALSLMHLPPECATTYLDYLVDGIRQNSYLVSHRQPVKPVYNTFA